VAGDNSERYLRIERNDFVYNDRTTKASIFGTIKRLSKHSGGIVSPIYKCFRFKGDENPVFWEWYFDSGIHNKALAGLVNEGARAGRFNISVTQFLSTSVWRPGEAEQQKIAKGLSSVDELIAAQARKVDALKKHKRGLMQKLFPRKGETQPRLRFPEFLGKAEWRVRTLNELLYESRARNRSVGLGPADVLSVSGEYGCVNQIQFMGRSYAGVSVKEYRIVEQGDVVYTKSPLKKNPFGIIKENKGKRGIVSTLYAVYRTFPGCSAAYVDHFFSVDYNLNSYLQPIVKKGPKNDMKVNNADVLRGIICVPDFSEQKKIADFLSSLDEVISAQTRKADALKALKKGLMQQLFPTPERKKP
jgi:type I restriction enzyme S subunit